MKQEAIKAVFSKYFNGQETSLIVRSPGRVNIIGEHTDYNEGFVLPAAIDKAAYIAFGARNDDEIHLVAHDLHEKFSVNSNDIKPVNGISWPNYILGCIAQFIEKGVELKGFNAVITSDVPIGSGLSSSAAVECATVFALNEFSQTGFDRLSMVKMAQKAEHEFAGVQCGIMDQFASMMGKKDHVIKLDCRTLQYEYIPFKLDGIKILLLNTNVKHSLASSAYNKRRQECETAVGWVKAKYPDVQSLRDVSGKMLTLLVEPQNSLIGKRSLFVVQEIERLLTGCEDLKNGDLKALGKKMFATHEGLSSMYEVSCKELDFLVNAVKNSEAVIGARMMGGGFGGCTINLVKEEAIGPLLSIVQPAYETQMNLPLTYYIAGIEDGTKII